MIQSQYTPDVYVGNGAIDTYAFNWRILAKTDLVLVETDLTNNVETELVLNTDYTVDDQFVNTTDGGDIVLTDPLGATKQLTISRDTAQTQLVNLTESGVFPSAVITKALDRTTMQIQELQYLISIASSGGGVAGLILGSDSIAGDASSHTVTLAAAMADATYTVFGPFPDWQTTIIITAKTTTGFTLEFGTQAPTAGGGVSYGVAA